LLFFSHYIGPFNLSVGELAVYVELNFVYVYLISFEMENKKIVSDT